MTAGYDALREAADWVRARMPQVPAAAVVLGSGLGHFTERVDRAVAFEYAAVPHWPRTSAVGHPGQLVLGTLRDRAVAVLAGRTHYYEGHDLGRVVFAVRVMGLLGVRVLILTNAAGGVNTAFERGGLMVIDDHINLLGSNPLIGPNDERLGPRFPDMTEVYSRRLRALADEAGGAAGVTLQHGVYAALHGPSYETPAEIRYLRTIGSDAVGMSTVPEAIAARHMGLEVLGISCISNMAAGVLPAPLSHEEVLETTRRVAAQFARVVEEIVARL
jgi:purine-nucleoside phosphorylase